MNIYTKDKKFIFKIEQGQASFESYNETKKVVNEVFEQNVYQIHPYDFSESMTFLDIGANIGVTSVFVASFNFDKQRVKDWERIKVFSYEPVPANVKLLKHNIEQNKVLEDVSIYPVAVAKTGVKQVFMSENLGNSKCFHNKTEKLVCVPAISINTIFKEHTKFADVVKIDVEGAEYEIIKDATLDTLKRIKKIVIEFHKTDIENFGLMIAKLSEVFNIHIIGSYNRGGYIYGDRY